MPERKLITPPPGIDVGPLFMDRYPGHYGLTDYNIQVFEKPFVAPDAPMVLFKGGWGDADAVSCLPLAMVAADTLGRAAIVSNRRLPIWNPLNAIAIARARRIRSEAVHAGLKVAHAYGSPHALVAGQSFGGDNAIDATLHALRHMPQDQRPERLSVLTIDTPGIYGDLDRTTSIAASLLGLVRSITQDFIDTPETGKWLMARMMTDSIRHRSPLETLYFGSEMLSLLHIDVSGSVQMLREEGVGVAHIFHAEDVVPRIDDPDAGVFAGGHGAALVRPVEVIDFAITRFMKEYSDPIAA